ncbi:MAG: 50S ribosomal protein L22 [Candidatus Yonathbacteria bacterium RIFOXYC1_FULL_52_10]|uniref:Large ribosomal subunit protein uL22 n=1 Tax=Candidatus Yonathbacteria bacterium RIFOXYD1_FULL_52_36 TaxID=1802730 RepID=A0A1G2SJS9_9BACT|nr:MAG: 50S ribosomal protein L22 [Candidatus Yonathbacteria bacterium RIFOXYC1_FULL_52_10]OHA84879.1 MAG: 50S ribosomal protein L22 [Candidatus Yonathbacteria bacterium RIFOXYD1_FULL_52_36]
MKAILSNYRQSPRKVRLVARMVQGKTVPQALNELNALTKRAALPMKKLIESAAANARHNFGATDEDLTIKSMRVDKGMLLKRSLPKARGSSSVIRKKASNVVVELVSKSGAQLVSKEAKAVAPKKSTEKAPAKKVEAKKPVKKTVKKA